MHRIVDYERGQAAGTCTLGENGQSQLEGRVRKTSLRVHLDDGRNLLGQQLGDGVRVDLAGLDRA